MEDSEHNARLRKTSGSIDDNRKLVAFLYDLMRDHLSVGTIEKIIRDTLNDTLNEDVIVSYQFTNGWLAQIAQDMAKRLT